MFISPIAGNNAIKRWTLATAAVYGSLITANLRNSPVGIAVDGAGNVYVANTFCNSILLCDAASNTVSTLSSNQSEPHGLALDTTGNLYFASYGSQTVRGGGLSRCWIWPRGSKARTRAAIFCQ